MSTAVMAPVSDADVAVAALYRSHRLPMVRLARLLVDDLETAEDVVQDAFAALHRRWTSVAAPDAAVSYLRTSVVNGSRSVLRRRRTLRANPWPDASGWRSDDADAQVLLD